MLKQGTLAKVTEDLIGSMFITQGKVVTTPATIKFFIFVIVAASSIPLIVHVETSSIKEPLNNYTS